LSEAQIFFDAENIENRQKALRKVLNILAILIKFYAASIVV